MQDRGTATLMARRSRRNPGTSMGAGLLPTLKGLRREGLGLGVGSAVVAGTMSVLCEGSVSTRSKPSFHMMCCSACSRSYRKYVDCYF